MKGSSFRAVPSRCVPLDPFWRKQTLCQLIALTRSNSRIVRVEAECAVNQAAACLGLDRNGGKPACRLAVRRFGAYFGRGVISGGWRMRLGLRLATAVAIVAGIAGVVALAPERELANRAPAQGEPAASVHAEPATTGALPKLPTAARPTVSPSTVATAPPHRRQSVPESREAIRLSFAPIVKRVAPAVVNVYATSRVQVRSPFEGDPFFERFFGGGESLRRAARTRALLARLGRDRRSDRRRRHQQPRRRRCNRCEGGARPTAASSRQRSC